MKITNLLMIIMTLFLMGCVKKEASRGNPVRELLSVRGVGKVIPEGEILALALEEEGVVGEIYYAENDTVYSGNPVLRLSTASQEEKIKQTDAQVYTQQKQIEAQRAILEEETIRLANKKTEFQRTERLYQQNAETGQVKDDAAAGVKIQEAVVLRVSRQLESELKRLDELLRVKNQDQIALSKRTLYAPQTGILLELPVKKGEYLKAGDIAVQMQPLGKIVVLCEVDELFAPVIRNGQTAFLISSASLDTLGTGKVIFTGKYLKKKSLFYEEAGESEDRRVLEVKILPDSVLPVLLNSKIECSVKTDTPL